MLLSLAEAGLFRPRWSARILDEAEKAIARITNGTSDTSKQRRAMERAFPEALVTGFEVFEDRLGLPDPDDNHVLAAAISTSASVIVSDNVEDFPAELLSPHGMEVRSADDFIADTIAIDSAEAILALKRMRRRFKQPSLDVDAIIQKAEAQGLLQTATIMQEYRLLL